MVGLSCANFTNASSLGKISLSSPQKTSAQIHGSPVFSSEPQSGAVAVSFLHLFMRLFISFLKFWGLCWLQALTVTISLVELPDLDMNNF